MSLLPLRGTLRQGGWRSGRNLGKTTSIDDVCSAEEVPRGCAGVEVSVESSPTLPFDECSPRYRTDPPKTSKVRVAGDIAVTSREAHGAMLGWSGHVAQAQLMLRICRQLTKRLIVLA
jgi:hypothetical protein